MYQNVGIINLLTVFTGRFFPFKRIEGTRKVGNLKLYGCNYTGMRRQIPKHSWTFVYYISERIANLQLILAKQLSKVRVRNWIYNVPHYQ